MKMFIFKYIDQVSGNYHTEGGLMVVAEDKEAVQKLIENEEYIEITEEEWEQVVIYDLKNEEESKIFVFPDAGCC